MTVKKIILPYVIIFAGFIFLMILFSWLNMQNSRTFVREQELPSLGLAVSSKLEQRAWQYQKAGQSLLQDNFIRDWIQTQNSDIEVLRQFMENIRQNFPFDLIDASIVNDLNETYYATTGEVIKLDPENIERDGWYYSYREMVDGTNLDSWFYSENDTFALYVNVPIISKNGTFLGVAGGGIDATQFMHNLNSFITKHDVSIFLIRQDGALIYPQDSLLVNQQNKNAVSLWGSTMFESIIRNESNIGGTLLENSKNRNSIFWSIYLEEWNTYLVIEKTIIPSHIQFIHNLLIILVSGGFFILFFSVITAFHVKTLWNKTLRQSGQHKKTIEKLKAIRKTQDCLLRDAERSLFSLGKNAQNHSQTNILGKHAIQKSVYIEECRSALKKYSHYKQTSNTKSLIVLETLIKKLLKSISSELERKNIRITTYNTNIKTTVVANEAILSLVIESLLLCDYDCEKSQCEIFISVKKFNGKPSIQIAGTELTKYLSNTDLDLQKSLLKEQHAHIETSEENLEKRLFYIIFESDVE